MAKDQREILFGQARGRVDHDPGRQGLDPCGEAIACGTQQRVVGIIKGSHASAYAGFGVIDQVPDDHAGAKTPRG
ncbi:hypothetical protein [Sphingomonas endophytica]|uniref:hypothetical protein n=1 Tax=Sphingomonas endophytica TaxID=869719 RepID=UPI00128EFE1C|nr:hypothetical protein [Sphingomonas endophytica]